MANRECEIVDGWVELASGAGDGAYDLLGVVGTPDEIGRAIAESLKECNLFRGGMHSAVEAGQDLFLKVRIRICNSK